MIPFLRRQDTHALAVAMAGVKMGDHLLYIGCADGGRLGAIALRVGLSGRAVAIVPDNEAAARARKGAAGAGVLVDVVVAPGPGLPAEDGTFDLAVVDDTAGLLVSIPDHDRLVVAREILRALKPAGRAVVIGSVPVSGWTAAFSRTRVGEPFDSQPLLQAGGFRLVRHLAEREGLRFVEGVKSR